MAKRRCISVEIFENDDFMEQSNEARLMYLYMILKGDDYGVVTNTRYMLRVTGYTQEAINELERNGYIIKVDNVYVITHWHIHNVISPSKRNDSLYQSQLDKLRLNKNKVYELSAQ